MESLVLRHHAEISRLLWRFARNASDLEDLVQETFLRLVRSLHTWRADRPFRHWITRIAANVGRDFYRRQSVRRRWTSEPLPAGENGAALTPEAIDPGADPAARAAANELKELLATLPADDRTLLTLHHLEGWDLKHIANQFGWTVTATKLRAWRARNRLRALLTEPHSP
ncbi:MAG TPA: RNA polymerase sigma factor [Opitutaceae bacterium]